MHTSHLYIFNYTASFVVSYTYTLSLGKYLMDKSAPIADGLSPKDIVAQHSINSEDFKRLSPLQSLQLDNALLQITCPILHN